MFGHWKSAESYVNANSWRQSTWRLVLSKGTCATTVSVLTYTMWTALLCFLRYRCDICQPVPSASMIVVVSRLKRSSCPTWCAPFHEESVLLTLLGPLSLRRRTNVDRGSGPSTCGTSCGHGVCSTENTGEESPWEPSTFLRDFLQKMKHHVIHCVGCMLECCPSCGHCHGKRRLEKLRFAVRSHCSSLRTTTWSMSSRPTLWNSSLWVEVFLQALLAVLSVSLL